MDQRSFIEISVNLSTSSVEVKQGESLELPRKVSVHDPSTAELATSELGPEDSVTFVPGTLCVLRGGTVCWRVVKAGSSPFIHQLNLGQSKDESASVVSLEVYELVGTKSKGLLEPTSKVLSNIPVDLLEPAKLSGQGVELVQLGSVQVTEREDDFASIFKVTGTDVPTALITSNERTPSMANCLVTFEAGESVQDAAICSHGRKYYVVFALDKTIKVMKKSKGVWGCYQTIEVAGEISVLSAPEKIISYKGDIIAWHPDPEGAPGISLWQIDGDTKKLKMAGENVRVVKNEQARRKTLSRKIQFKGHVLATQL